MGKYLLARSLQNLVLLVLVSIIGFGVLHLAPGGPLAQFALVPGMSQADIARIAHQMGLDRPLPAAILGVVQPAAAPATGAVPTATASPCSPSSARTWVPRSS